jgi:hypothetical protein
MSIGVALNKIRGSRPLSTNGWLGVNGPVGANAARTHRVDASSAVIRHSRHQRLNRFNIPPTLSIQKH